MGQGKAEDGAEEERVRTKNGDRKWDAVAGSTPEEKMTILEGAGLSSSQYYGYADQLYGSHTKYYSTKRGEH